MTDPLTLHTIQVNGTPFKRYEARAKIPDSCAFCRHRIVQRHYAFKPSENKGGYKMSARICMACGSKIAAEAGPKPDTRIDGVGKRD